MKANFNCVGKSLGLIGSGCLVTVALLAALAATVGPLPHYGGRSYVVFDGRRAIDQGTWRAAGDHALRRRL